MQDVEIRVSSEKTHEKARSSQRIRYDAEVSALKKRVGNLDEIRGSLGLTQRKMAQLLLVDPSAWTRWTRDGEDAPPIVYRALGWYLALEGKYPALSPDFWLKNVAKLPAERESEIELRFAEIQAGIARLAPGPATAREAPSSATPKLIAALLLGVLIGLMGGYGLFR